MNEFRTKDTWTVFRIMAEFVEGFETLASVWPAVSVFGGARIARDTEIYRQGSSDRSVPSGAEYDPDDERDPVDHDDGLDSRRKPERLTLGLRHDLRAE